jgi:arylsulfatase A-like enzyme
LGYATGQFGKNHRGDLNKFLPTVHGFDEFFGNLYHLNAEEEPEAPNWPSAVEFPQFNARFAPRGVLHSWAIAGTIRPRTNGTGGSGSSESRTPGR